MTTQDLKNRYLGYSFKNYGHFKIGFIFRNKGYFTTTTNTLAIDRIDDELPERTEGYYTTQKQALLSLYNEVKKANDLH